VDWKGYAQGGEIIPEVIRAHGPYLGIQGLFNAKGIFIEIAGY